MKRFISFVTAFVMVFVMMLHYPMPINVKAISVYVTSQEIVDKALSKVGSYYPADRCLSFVDDLFAEFGASRDYSCCAHKLGNSIICSYSMNDIPLGADVFFNNSSGWYCDNCGNIPGHIGIYIGNGQMVEASNGTVNITSLSYFNRNHWSYWGWGYHVNINIKNNVTPSKPTLSISSGTTASKTTFSWNACSDANRYDVRIYNSGESKPFIYQETADTSLTYNLPEGSYYATVASVNTNHVTWTFSDAVGFTVDSGIFEPKAVTSYNGHVYALYDNFAYYDQARQLCNNMGGHLATITSKEENDIVTSLMGSSSGDSSYWIGGTRSGNTWKWETGEPYTENNFWQSGEPNNDNGNENYIMMYPSGTWNDVYSYGKSYRGFILEIDSLPIAETSEYNGHIYYRFDSGLNWTEANEYCKMLGGNLAVITSEKENEFVHNFIKDGSKKLYWIGLYDPDKTKNFKWENDEEYSYSNWNENQPDCAGNSEFFVEMYRENGKWNDNRNYVKGAEGFICEIDKKVKNISIVAMPDKTEYYLGEAIDLTGMSLKVQYEQGADTVETKGFTANADMNTLGKQTVTVTYKGAKANYEINVKCPKPEVSFVSKTDSSFELSWKEIPIASEYAVLVNGSESVRTADNRCTVTGLNASTEYEVQVVAYDNNKTLESSEYAYITTAHRITFSGAGTSDNPYLIANSQDLVCLSEMINDKLTNVHFKNAYYKQTNDINMNGISFEPIGNGTVFAGKYDGNCHEINNLYIDTTAEYTGLFGKVGEPENSLSEISNLVVRGNVNSNQTYTGGLAGLISYNTNIYACAFYGEVSGVDIAGGLIGKVEKGGVISNCYHNGHVLAMTAGGICGQITKASEAGNDAFIVNTYHHNGTIEGYTYKGGICGFVDYAENTQGIVSLYNNFYEKDSAAYGIGNGESSDAKAVNHTVISAIGETLGAPFKDHEDDTRNNGCPVFVWELPMYNFVGNGTADNPYLIRNKEELIQLADYLNDTVYSSMFNKAYYQQTADIDLDGVDWKAMSGYKTSGFNGVYDGGCHTVSNLTVNSGTLGGFFGYVSVGTIENLVINNGNIKLANGTAGGVTAQLGNGATIQYCAYNGNITADVSGGVVGEAFDRSTINSSYSNGNVTGKTAAGGIVASVTYNSATINNSYHGEGKIKAESAGGISGKSNTHTIITNCYYIKDSATGTNLNDDGTAVSDKLMKSLADTLETPFSGSEKYPVFSWLENSTSKVLKGDINYDDTVSIADAVLLQRYLLGTYSISTKQAEAADINADKHIDVFDMIFMRKIFIQKGVK